MRLNLALAAALSRWELIGRAELPTGRCVIERRPGKERRAIYRTDTGEPVYEPDAHIQRAAESPDGRWIALQLDAHADERSALALLEISTSRLVEFPGITCRYDPMLWAADSSAVEFVARSPQRIVRIDVDDARVSDGAELNPGARFRLFPGSFDGVLVESSPASWSQICDRRTLESRARFPSVVDIHDTGGGLVVQTSRSVHGLDRTSCETLWTWSDPNAQITAVSAHREYVFLSIVRAGRSRGIVLHSGRVQADFAIESEGGVSVATSMGFGPAGDPQFVLESAALSPRVVTLAELPTDGELSSDGALSFGIERSATGRWNEAVAGPRDTRTTMVEATAADGTRLTAAVTSSDSSPRPMPVLLTCYGGFGVCNMPTFEPTTPAWIEHGGAVVTAQIRGGGEHGPGWRAAGYGTNKRNAIDDLAAIAREIVSIGLTTPDQLTVLGSSLGGTIATACALRYPQLFSRVISTAAPLDLLRLDDEPLGHLWTSEFGELSTREGSNARTQLSPLHIAEGIAPGTRLPRFLGIVLDEDSRVGGASTEALGSRLAALGADATVVHIPAAGHGRNHLSQLHDLGATVLSFAADPQADSPATRSHRRSDEVYTHPTRKH